MPGSLIAPIAEVRRTVLVEDVFGSPVVDARVEVQGKLGKLEGRMYTDGWGLAELHIRSSGADLLVSARGFLSERLGVQEAPEEVTVVLRGGGVVRGRVVWVSGEPAGSGLEVIAWRQDLASPRHERAPVGFVSAVTDDSGSFELTGLEPARKYALDVGAPGAVTRDAVWGLLPGQEDVVLTLCPYYATRIQLIDEVDGRRVRSSDAYVGHGPTWPVHLEDAEAHWPAGSATWFGDGLDYREIRDKSNGLSLISYRGKSPKPTIGPTTVTVNVLGYEPAKFSVPVPRAGGELGLVRLPMTPTGEVFSKLEVLFLGHPGSLSGELDFVDAPAVLRLRDLQDNRLVKSDVWGLQDGKLILSGIPLGEYACDLRFNNDLTVIQPVEGSLVVFHGGRNSVTFDVASLGSISLELYNARGEAVEQTVLVQYQDLLRGAHGTVRIAGGTYAVHDLMPSEYELSLAWPKSSGRVRVFVEAGETSHATLFLAE